MVYLVSVVHCTCVCSCQLFQSQSFSCYLYSVGLVGLGCSRYSPFYLAGGQRTSAVNRCCRTWSLEARREGLPLRGRPVSRQSCVVGSLCRVSL